MNAQFVTQCDYQYRRRHRRRRRRYRRYHRNRRWSREKRLRIYVEI